MAKKKACKNCKHLMDASETNCPACNGNQFVNTFKGRVAIVNVEKSDIAKKIGAKINGEYAIKTR
ncbi:transcription elongation factor subunit Spt4 [Nanoarchaeota archaeon]